MTFYFFRCSTDTSIYAITDKPELPESVNEELCKFGYWTLDRSIKPDDAHMYLSDEFVKRDIAQRGYSIVRWSPESRTGKKARNAG